MRAGAKRCRDRIVPTDTTPLRQARSSMTSLRMAERVNTKIDLDSPKVATQVFPAQQYPILLHRSPT
jgi:hypothetical protein